MQIGLLNRCIIKYYQKDYKTIKKDERQKFTKNFFVCFLKIFLESLNLVARIFDKCARDSLLRIVLSILNMTISHFNYLSCRFYIINTNVYNNRMYSDLFRYDAMTLEKKSLIVIITYHIYYVRCDKPLNFNL